MGKLVTRLSSTVGVLLFLTIAAAASGEENSPSRGDWIPLFNGRDLNGWTPKITGFPVGENYANTFRVANGVLQVGYEGYDQFKGRFGHLFYRHPYAHYRLRAEYRFVGQQVPGGPGWALRNSGIMIHGQDPQTMAVDQDFPVCIEVQLLGGDGSRPRSTGNLCTPGTNVVMDGKLVTRHCTNSSSPTFHGDQWVTVEIEVRGNQSVKHIINGETVLTYTNPQLDPRDPDARALMQDENNIMLSGGTISLQSESHPVEFRTVELKVL